MSAEIRRWDRILGERVILARHYEDVPRAGECQFTGGVKIYHGHSYTARLDVAYYDGSRRQSRTPYWPDSSPWTP